MENLTNIIEAVLFAAGDPVPTKLIAAKYEVTRAEINKSIRELQKKYGEGSGIRLLQFNGKLQLSTNPTYKNEVAALLTPIREKEFTRTILECAAIIAYRQPITKAELEQIRGVSCDYAIRTLLEIEMIRPRGRKDVPGKPILYATTDNFLKRFQLKSLSELPDYKTLLKRISAKADEDNYLFASNEPEADDKNTIPDFLADENNVVVIE